MTLDADILILTKDQQKVEVCLEAYQYQKKGALSIGGSTWVSATGEVLDVFGVDETIGRPNARLGRYYQNVRRSKNSGGYVCKNFYLKLD